MIGEMSIRMAPTITMAICAIFILSPWLLCEEHPQLSCGLEAEKKSYCDVRAGEYDDPCRGQEGEELLHGFSFSSSSFFFHLLSVAGYAQVYSWQCRMPYWHP